MGFYSYYTTTRTTTNNLISSVACSICLVKLRATKKIEAHVLTGALLTGMPASVDRYDTIQLGEVFPLLRYSLYVLYILNISMN
jgi:hypothetical protein